MKKIYFFLMMLVCSGVVKGQIAAWDFFGESSPATSTADVFSANLDASNTLTRGGGAAASAASNSFRTQGFMNNGISVLNTDYFQFSLSANTGYVLSLTTIDSRVNGTGTFANSPGVSQQYAYSLDGGTTFTLIGSPSISIGTNQTFSVDLSAISALQNLADGVTVIFRFYASGQTTTGGWGYFSGAAAQYGLAIAGTLIPSATPSLGVSQSSLSFGSVPVGSASTPAQTFNLSGANLTGAPGNITVTSPSTDFEVSNDNATFGPSTTIPYTSATLVNTPVYVRFTPQTTGSKSGNITFSGGGVAVPPTVALTGIGTQTYFSKPAGNLTNVATWGTVADGSGASPADFTTDGQIFVITNRATVTLEAPWTVSGSGSKVITGDGSSATEFIIPTGAPLTGIIDVANLGTLRLENTTLPTFGTFATGSTVNFAQAGAFVIPVATYYNLTGTGGTKTMAGGVTTVNGNMVLDGVTGFNGSSPTFSTINLAGNFNLVNASTFEPNGVSGDANRLTLAMTGSGTQQLNGGNFYLFRLQTPASPSTSLTISLVSANLFLGNPVSGGLNLLQSSHILSLNGQAMTLQQAGIISASSVGTISGSATSEIYLTKSAGTATLGTLNFTAGAQQLSILSMNSTAPAPGNTVTLGTPLSVVGTLDLTAGHIFLGTNNLTANLITGALSVASFVVTNGTGTVTVPNVGAVPRNFPVGPTTTLYHPVMMVNSGTPDNFSVRVASATPPCSPAATSVNATWDISEATPGGSNCTLTLDYTGATTGGSYGIVGAQIVHCNGAVADYHAGTVTGTIASGSGFTTFSPFGITNDLTALPVGFTAIKASQQTGGIKVEWTNITETDVLSYSVERSADGYSFTGINVMNARLNNGSRADYSFLDVTAPDGVNYYRINARATNGSSKYSIIVKVNTKGGKTDITVYPNPVTDNQLSFQATALPKGQYTIRVINAGGQQVYSKQLQHNGGAVTETVQLPAAVTKGMYSLQLTGGEVKLTKTFIVR